MKNKLILCKNMLGQQKKANFTNKFNFINKNRYDIITSSDSNNLYSNLFDLWKITNEHNRPTVLGGDHSLAISTLSSSIFKYGTDIKILWIDAHADINTYTSSHTKNVHGMVLNYICDVNMPGIFESICDSYQKLPFLPHIKVDPTNIMYIGIRDLDDYEKDVLKYYNISQINCNNVNNNPDKCIEQINTFVGNDKFHLSIDIDALDPYYVPCTGTPVEHGIELHKLLYILKNMNMKNKIHTDIVEYNPSLGNIQQQHRTQETINALLNAT